jgi:hypothetical protein
VLIPVVDTNQRPLMPTRPRWAKKWIRSGKATPFWKRGIFCVRLNYVIRRPYLQEIVVGIDPGSKKEGFTVKSECHTFLNIQADAVTWVSKHVEQRSQMRRTRRSRKTPYRKCRSNRAIGGIPPSTKARWQWKLRIIWWLRKMYPIKTFVVEDLKAWTKKGQRKWNRSFSPLETGKHWFYSELGKLGHVELKAGYETKELRDELGLRKTSNKLSNSFYAH